MADVAAEAEAFLQSMQGQVEASEAVPLAGTSADPAAADLIAQAQAAAASFSAQLAEQAQQQQAAQSQQDGQTTPATANGTVEHTANGSAQPPEEGATEGRRKRRNRWGNPSGAEGTDTAAAQAGGTPEATEGGGKKKRRSRWEDPDENKDLSLTSHVPKELMLPGGIKVRGSI